MQTYRCAHIHTHAHTHTHTYTQTHTHTHTHTHAHIHTNTHTHTQVYIKRIHAHPKAEGETDRQTSRQTDSLHTHTHTHTHTQGYMKRIHAHPKAEGDRDRQTSRQTDILNNMEGQALGTSGELQADRFSNGKRTCSQENIFYKGKRKHVLYQAACRSGCCKESQCVAAWCRCCSVVQVSFCTIGKAHLGMSDYV